MDHVDYRENTLTDITSKIIVPLFNKTEAFVFVFLRILDMNISIGPILNETLKDEQNLPISTEQTTSVEGRPEKS